MEVEYKVLVFVEKLLKNLWMLEKGKLIIFKEFIYVFLIKGI